jgi:predicted nucleic acid-binding protein
LIILDSSVLVASEVDGDINHERAVKLLREVAKEKFGKVFTSDYIFDETVTVTLVRTKNLRKAILAGTYIMDSTEVLKVDSSTFEKAWEIFKRQKKVTFSFTDCTILALMQEKGIKNIATFDEDFKKINVIGVE